MKSTIISGKTILFLFLMITGFTACKKIELGREYNFRVGEKYNIDWNLSFSIDSIREYRCPKGLMCFWAGDVDLFFNINLRNKQIDTLIYLMHQGRNPFTIDGYTWRVLEVNPYPEFDKPVNPEDIRIKMIITKD